MGFFGPTAAGDALASLQGHKIVGTLEIIGRAEGNSSSSTFGFGVGRIGFVVNLAVGTDGDAAVGREIGLDARNNGAGGVDGGDPVRVG